MPRTARKSLNGKFFHIMVQGLNKEHIFKEDNYKEKYMEILSKKIKEFDIEIIAYCVMDNHAHILIYVDKVDNLSRCMQKVNTIYAIFYNRINNRVGFVFRDRFKVQTIKNEMHLMACISYIHKNPIKAEIVDRLDKYKYSSYNEYLYYDKRNIISNKSAELVFGAKNFEKIQEQYINLHKLKFEEEFIENDSKVDYNNLIKEYRLKNMKDNEIVILLNKQFKVSIREIAKLMNLTRYKVTKILEDK